MKPETRMDCLMQRITDFNELVDLREVEPDTDTKGDDEKSKGKGGKAGGRSSWGGFFAAVMGEIFFRRNRTGNPSILSITHPSDGQPQEELTPDFNWFRPLSWNNPTWTLYWPELIV